LGIKLIVPAIVSILILGSLGMDQQSFGGQVETSTVFGGDQNPPDYRDDDCAVTYAFAFDPLIPVRNLSPVHGGICTEGELSTLDADGEPIPSVEYKTGDCPEEVTGQDTEACDAVHLMIPNFIDDLNTKKVRIQVTYDPQASTPSVKHPGGVKEDVTPGPSVNDEICFRDAPPTFGSGGESSGFFSEDWTCHPNPVNEVIWLDITGAEITEIVVDTVSFDANAVGGDMIQMQTTSVLAAGAQYTAAWMIPVIVSGIGIAIVIARKF